MIKRTALTIFKILLALSCYIGIEQLIKLKTYGFCLQRILATDLPHKARFENPPLTAEEKTEIDRLLSQPYRMIGAGSECFAFASQDGKAVIKFFKLDRTRTLYFHRGIFREDYSAYAGTLSDHPWTRATLPSPFQKALKSFLGMREYRINRSFSSIKLSYDALREETGLLYLHLNPTNDLNKTLTIYDACGIAHEVELDGAKFFLQKKAVQAETHFAALKKKGADDLAKTSIDSFIALIVDRCKKGYADRDFINRNVGFIGSRAIEIDAGSFQENAAMRHPWLYTHELFYATYELRLWFKKHYPEMIPYLELKVNEEIYRTT